jgi:transcriptional regulator with XRE-family HTH domain
VPFSSLLRFSRERVGMSARQLSAAAGLSPSYVNKVEAGTMPSLQAFAKLAKAAEMTDAEIAFAVRMYS